MNARIAVLACAASLIAAPAFAHAFLKHASPGVGAMVKTPPPALVLTYTEDLEVPFCKVVVTGPGGAQVSAKPRAVPGHRDELSVPLHITAAGTYHVTWHALSVDTHKTEGSFSFTVGV
jgi:methionine-rich copper-binding protein CopC